jgi:hypothetical protein
LSEGKYFSKNVIYCGVLENIWKSEGCKEWQVGKHPAISSSIAYALNTCH